MEKAGQYRKQAKDFSKDEEKFRSLYSKFEAIKEKALEHKAKSEVYYQRAMDNYTRKLSDRMDEVSTHSPGSRDLNRGKIAELKQQFVEKFIPVGELSTLEKITSGNSPFIDLETKLSVEFASQGLENEYFVEYPGVGEGHEEAPGFDGPGDDGDFPGSDSEDGGIDGPGISFDD
jgi:hypothetical protein